MADILFNIVVNKWGELFLNGIIILNLIIEFIIIVFVIH